MGKTYRQWLEPQTQAKVIIHPAKLDTPTDFRQFMRRRLQPPTDCRAVQGCPVQRVFHLSPGTPAMAAVWLLIGKTLYPAELIESSVQAGVRSVEVPFDIAADYLPRLIDAADAHALEFAQAARPPPRSTAPSCTGATQ